MLNSLYKQRAEIDEKIKKVKKQEHEYNTVSTLEELEQKASPDRTLYIKEQLEDKLKGYANRWSERGGVSFREGTEPYNAMKRLEEKYFPAYFDITVYAWGHPTFNLIEPPPHMVNDMTAYERDIDCGIIEDKHICLGENKKLCRQK